MAILAEKNKRRYVVLIPIGLMIVFCVFFQYYSREFYDALMREKITEKEEDISQIIQQVDRFVEQDQDWNTDHQYYVDSVVFCVETLDAQSGTFAAVYDDQLRLLSRRVPDAFDGLFDPQQYENFINAAERNETGEMELMWHPSSGEKRTQYLYYHWLPSNEKQPNRMMAVISITKNSLLSTEPSWVSNGIILIISITSALSVYLMVMILQVWDEEKVRKDAEPKAQGKAQGKASGTAHSESHSESQGDIEDGNNDETQKENEAQKQNGGMFSQVARVIRGLLIRNGG